MSASEERAAQVKSSTSETPSMPESFLRISTCLNGYSKDPSETPSLPRGGRCCMKLRTFFLPPARPSSRREVYRACRSLRRITRRRCVRRGDMAIAEGGGRSHTGRRSMPRPPARPEAPTCPSWRCSSAGRRHGHRGRHEHFGTPDTRPWERAGPRRPRRRTGPGPQLGPGSDLGSARLRRPRTRTAARTRTWPQVSLP